ncbi:MAG: protein-tyrosine phosphatase [Psychroserpens sp.]|jgi:protein-tyrosine phosphatase
MFNFFSKTDRSLNAFEFLGTDMHSHLLPGVDDGSNSVMTSLELIEGLKALGFNKIITTPHVYQDFYPNTKDTLEPAFKAVKQALLLNSIEMDFQFSAEYFADDFLHEMINKRELISLPNKHLLIEISFVAYSKQLEQLVFELTTLGFTPILAHPERYLYLNERHFNTYKKLISLGCKLQLNINSLGGYYGKSSQKLAFALLEARLVTFLGTDIHNFRHLEFLNGIAQNNSLMQTLRKYPWSNDTF